MCDPSTWRTVRESKLGCDGLVSLLVSPLPATASKYPSTLRCDHHITARGRGGMPATVLLKWWFRIYLHQWFSTGLSSGPTCVISRSIGMQRSGIFSGQSWYRSQIFYFVKYILRRWTEMRGHKYSPIPGVPSWGAADWQQEVWFTGQKLTGIAIRTRHIKSVWPSDEDGSISVETCQGKENNIYQYMCLW